MVARDIFGIPMSKISKNFVYVYLQGSEHGEIASRYLELQNIKIVCLYLFWSIIAEYYKLFFIFILYFKICSCIWLFSWILNLVAIFIVKKIFGL